MTPLPKKIVPVTREDNHESQAAVRRVTPAYDKEVHIIPLEETQEELITSVLDPPKGKNIIPMEEDKWDQTQAYIHKYNIRSSHRYAFAAATTATKLQSCTARQNWYSTMLQKIECRADTRTSIRSLEEKLSKRIWKIG